MEFDKDLTARQEARELARRAETAQRKLTELSQSQLDAIVEAVAKAFAAQASALAEMAVQETLRDEQQMEELKRQNLQAEMDYLRYQINPHFFMNTLNNIHALIDIDTEYAKSAVIELSKMMRYVLYESGSETISLKKDIQFIENYIELMRIRYDSSIDICLDYPATIPNKVCHSR